MTKQIAPAAIETLKEALTLVYWYKSNLRSFLSQCLSDPAVLSRLNWSDYKRNIVATLVDHLTAHQDLEEEARHAEERRKETHRRLMQVNAVQKQLETIKAEFFELVASENPQQRGFLLEIGRTSQLVSH